MAFREAVEFQNERECLLTETVIHVAMTWDETYMQGSIAGVSSVLQHASCPENMVFHFISTHRHTEHLRRIITMTFPYLSFNLYRFESNLIKDKISYSIRQALD